jgi:hypothetical protein
MAERAHVREIYRARRAMIECPQLMSDTELADILEVFIQSTLSKQRQHIEPQQPSPSPGKLKRAPADQKSVSLRFADNADGRD